MCIRDRKSIDNVESALKAFGEAVHKYRGQLINGADSAYFYTEYTRDISFTIVAAAATTAAAPAIAGSATMLTAMKTMAVVGLKVGGSVGLIKGFAGEMGAKLVDKNRRWTTIAFNTLAAGAKGAATGFFAGAIGGAVCKGAAEWVAKYVSRMEWLQKQAWWYMYGNTKILSKGIQKLITPENGPYVLDALSTTVAKFGLRLGVAGITIWVRNLLIRNREWLYKAFEKALKKCRGNETMGRLSELIFHNLDLKKIGTSLIAFLIKKASSELEKTAVNIPIMAK